MLLNSHNVRWLLLASVAGLSLPSCGGRSGIPEGDGTEPLIPCASASDCFDGNFCATKACVNGYCKTVSKVSCNDGDACTSDACEPSTGECVFQPRVSDADGDGYLGALPGTVPGAADACGNDCNDADPKTYPGATEICDGQDNNCDGSIDEGVNAYNPLISPIRISDSSFDLGGVNGLAFGSNRFGITWTGQQNGKNYQGYASGYDIFGFQQFSTTNISQTSNDSFAGPLVWNGSKFATAWEVRAEKGYDIVFNQLDGSGQKLGPDVRISNNYGFSVQPALLWNGLEYWVVWSDDNGGDFFQIFGRKVNESGQLGPTNELSPLMNDARSPVVVQSPTSPLLVYLSATTQRVMGQPLSKDLTRSESPVYISDTGASGFSVARVGDRFIVVWSIERDYVGPSIWGASIDGLGNILVPARPLTQGANFSRAPSVESLGDRFALAWADDRLKYGHYGIRLSTFDVNLNPLSAVTTLVESDFDCIDPGLAVGGSGMALVYRERTNGDVGQPYFLPLACAGNHLPY